MQELDVKPASVRHKKWSAFGKTLGRLENVRTDNVGLAPFLTFLPHPVGSVGGSASPGAAPHALDRDGPWIPKAYTLVFLCVLFTDNLFRRMDTYPEVGDSKRKEPFAVSRQFGECKGGTPGPSWVTQKKTAAGNELF